jgi:hypothetical protein
MTNHPCLPARREVVGRDIGGWISGPSLNVEEVTADTIAVGDRIIKTGLPV